MTNDNDKCKQEIKNAFLLVGINLENEEQTRDVQQDFNFLTEFRKRQQDLTKKALLVVVGSLTTGLITIVVLGIEGFLK